VAKARVQARTKVLSKNNTLPKAPTGIAGLDELTQGGLPRGRSTLVSGRAGSGKTVLGLEFLVRGAVEFGEPGVIVSFEETAEDLARNVASFGFDLNDLVQQRKLALEFVSVERSEIEETGEYNLDGLFIRLAHAIESVGAKRVLLDTIESLFSGLTNMAILRAEIRRLFHWLKSKRATVVLTGEQGEGTLTRQGLEEYVSDCVIALNVQIVHHVATRMMRVVKYRGSGHSPDEYPFIIRHEGISVMPITSLELSHEASTERISSGNAELDGMLGGSGFYRGSTVLVAGTSGTGKTSVAAYLADAACRRGQRCIYFAFEESPAQLLRNMSSIGLDLTPFVNKGLLRIEATRPSLFGLEMHLAASLRAIEEFNPSVVVVDPITDFVALGTAHEVRSMMTRLVDYLKSREITALMTSLSISGRTVHSEADAGISSLIDTWILVQLFEVAGERNRGISVLKVARHGALEPNPRIYAGARRSDAGPAVSRPTGLPLRLGPRGARGSRENDSVEGERSMSLLRSGPRALAQRPPRPRRPARPEKDFYQLRLYVAGQTARAQSALRNLEAVCETHLRGKYRIEVVDLLVNPQLARGDQIIAVPTLVRQLPPPMKKIIGDLSNVERVLVGLDLRALPKKVRP
jgi:circadian clock protein KaiC